MNVLTRKFALGSAALLLLLETAVAQTNYEKGSVISPKIVVSNAQSQAISLRSLLSKTKPLNIVVIFGGGGLGHETANKNDGLWCHDSFGDMTLLRNLVAKYTNKVEFVGIAVPPVFHTQYMGLSKDVYFQPTRNTDEFAKATRLFVETTVATVENGTVPFDPYYDFEFDLLTNPKAFVRKGGRKHDWQGAFSKPNSQQTYGVPSIWLVDSDGVIVEAPFRNNVYYSEKTAEVLTYRQADIEAAIIKHLQ